ncbi:MAG: DNA primase [Clostridiales bacterium]|nr:DNA primase [Candidatus Equinaster intestinalis]
MAIPEEILQEIKYRNDIESVISPYVDLKRRGKILTGLCPFHNEKTPSFTVYTDSNSFYCFGCGVGGDIFTFTKLIENLDYIEAVKALAERSGVTLPQDGYDDSMQRFKQTVLNINKETARFYHSYLMSPGGKWALDYLVGRGLKIQTIKHFGLGAAPDSWDSLYKHLKSLGFKDEDMYQANVISKSSKGSYFDRFRNRVMFPIINLRGNVIAFSGRKRPDDDKAAKYINSADTVAYKKSQNLFGINFAKNCCSERVILVEGNMDVVSLHQAGFENTVAPLGTAFTLEQVKLLSRYTKEIVITMDADAAGQKSVMRAIDIMKDSGLPVRVLVLPECKDPDEYIKKFGSARFKLLLDGAVSEMEYLLLRAAENIDVSTDDGRLKYLHAAAEILAGVNDAITVDMYVGKLSEKYGVSRSALNVKINEIRKSKMRERKKKEIRDIITPKFKTDDINPERRKNARATAAEEGILSVLLRHPDLFEETEKNLTADDFMTSFNKRLFEEFSAILKRSSEISVSAFSDRFSPAETGFIVSLQNNAGVDRSPKDTLADCIAVLKKEKRLETINSTVPDSNDDWEQQLKTIINLKKGD